MSKDHKKRIFSINKNKDIRKDLRNNSTIAEKMVWKQLKNNNFLDLRFRRQHGIGNYIVDFYCPSQNLIIEIDGDSHYTNDALEYDKKRTAFLESEGLRVLRFTNTDIYKNLSDVLEEIKKVIK